ncbi:MAG: phosphate uptake regulator PhoU [Nitrososphaerota archaeon]|nr:phosphate uptake regulator PhoU [Nitrososphaerota archaeon]MDG6967297.1 phosphate uptake regulator PhoU [Nitrososphaerota archaeon]MDG6977928.1 phosphate uptake regulator PhoU [Nitrososphaerota archaeon]MDG7020838.1 phosphate uptake regulator PhoU [Nitrososphaerota archaeon]MDG7022542.1 phosphate uptake regulator PhoU [Nitrososphaerota archaeon]
MPRLMDLAMERLTNLLLEMGDLSRKTVLSALDAYTAGTSHLEVETASTRLKKLDDQVSEIAIELIARFQPVASDLRYIKASLEISYGFYRYGRYAHDIMEVLQTFGDLTKCSPEVVAGAAEKTNEMIRLSVEAFANQDVELARTIITMDDYVDSAYRDYIKKLMKSKKVDIRCALSETLILRYLERIADHAVYIANSVIFIVKGEEPSAADRS